MIFNRKNEHSESEKNIYPSLNDIFSQSPIAIELYDINGFLLDVNQACLTLFGIRGIEEVKDFNLFDDPNLNEQIISDIRSGKAIKYELIFSFDLVKSKNLYRTSRDGTCYLECFINPTTDDRNKINGYMVHLTEITERKHIEDSLIRNEEQCRMLVDLAPDAFFQGDANGNFITINNSAIILTGYSRDELLKMNMKDLFLANYLSQNPLRYDLLERGEVLKMEREIITETGSSVIVEMKSKKLPDGTFQSFFRDITERKQIKKALRKSEEKFRRIVESSTNGMYFYQLKENDRLVVVGANPAADLILGISHQTLLGKTIEEAFLNLIHTDLPEKFKSIAKGKEVSQVFDLDYKDELISGFYNVRVFQTEKNTITVSFTDISERKKAELLLEVQARELKELNATKDKFLSIIAHDLKNPFNAILGFSDLMLKNFYQLDDETLLKGLSTIESASVQAYKLLENLLIWSQNQTGRREFTPEILNLKAQVMESLGTIESIATKKEIRIIVSINKYFKIFADKNMIDLIFRNLISNAVKFSYKKSKIKITATTTDHEIQISIIDNGVGIASENLFAIFKIDKHRITLGTDDEQGSGLGLILCNDFITRHNGNIRVESVPGKGSVFTISLPFN